MKKGFSLVEILTTVVILAVLAAIAFPGFSKARRKSEAGQAITYLRAIRLAEKMHYAKNGSYVEGTFPAGCVSWAAMGSAADINACLGTEIVDGNYVFSVAAAAQTFTATATGYGETIILDQEGTWSGSYSPLPAD